jgi:hypothetical protein
MSRHPALELPRYHQPPRGLATNDGEFDHLVAEEIGNIMYIYDGYPEPDGSNFIGTIELWDDKRFSVGWTVYLVSRATVSYGLFSDYDRAVEFFGDMYQRNLDHNQWKIWKWMMGVGRYFKPLWTYILFFLGLLLAVIAKEVLGWG